MYYDWFGFLYLLTAIWVISVLPKSLTLVVCFGIYLQFKFFCLNVHFGIIKPQVWRSNELALLFFSTSLNVFVLIGYTMLSPELQRKVHNIVANGFFLITT